MSGANHTPGPWETDEHEHDAPHQNIMVMHAKNRTVCTVWIDDAPCTDFNSEQEANARLISAAPELLEAAEAGRKYYQALYRRAEGGEFFIDAGGALTEGVDLDTLFEDWMHKSENAINKAKGQTK